MKKMPEVEDISFQSISDWFICLNEWPHVTLMCSSWVCTMLCDLSCSRSHKFPGWHSKKAPCQDVFVLYVASPVLSKGKTKVCKIATVLGPTVVFLLPFHFLVLTSNLRAGPIRWKCTSGPVLEDILFS